MSQALFWTVFLALYFKSWRIFLRRNDRETSLLRLGNLPEYIHGPYRRGGKEKRLRA